MGESIDDCLSSSRFGEFGLIEWIRRRQGGVKRRGTAVGIGDDCAVLETSPGSKLLVTTDMLMDGRHFQLEIDGPEAVGVKAMGVNLSDIAAMAGVPRAAVVAVALPRDAAVAIAQGVHAGLQKMAEKYEVDLIGGDTNAWAGPLVISLTVLGETTSRGPVLRSGARPGDVIMVTGPLGGSLYRGRHLRPEPRLREALALHEAAELSAMIDISDGLSSDLTHILEESGGLGAMLEASGIPVHPDAALQSRGDGIPAIEHALNDGEDFELCLTVAPELAQKVLDNPPQSVTLFRVGVVTPEPGLRLRHSDGRIVPVLPRGFDHFRDAGSSATP